ncbi:MAG: hypothetical protein JNM80_10825, partial [Phycisphaerae bacterium]|nr:hypothetical protein [Phycisphaerae bacterium]
RAQEAFEFSWEVKDVAGLGPTNANGIIEPGEDAQIFFNVSFRPGVGGSAVWDTLGGTGQIGTVVGLGQVIGRLMADANLNTGTWTGIGYRSGFNLGIPPSAEPPHNHLVQWSFGQFVPPGLSPNPLNDDWFFWAKWRPLGYEPRHVAFHFENGWGTNPSWPFVILDIGSPGEPDYREDTWAFNTPAGGFDVVPSPGAALVALAGGFMLGRRSARHPSKGSTR